MDATADRLRVNARALRNNATDAERKLWNALSRVRPRFTRQLVIGHFIADLACRKARLVVELDGGQHDGQREADARRTDALAASGWKVVRFWNNEVLANTQSVVELILMEVAARVPEDAEPVFIASRTGRPRTPRASR